MDLPKDICLNIKLGKDTFQIPLDRALTGSVEDLPIPEPIEEIMATSTFEFFDSDLEEDIGEMPEEVSNAEEESGEPSELPATKTPSRPPIELKPLPFGLRYAFLNSCWCLPTSLLEISDGVRRRQWGGRYFMSHE